MAIIGAHVLLYTPEADALRALLADVMGWISVEANPGWPIFALPRAELGVHPSDTTAHELSLMCDNITTTVADLRSRGVEFRDDPQDVGWGITTTMVLPGGLEVSLYQPRHPTTV
jgi:hypothetical protein